MSPSTVTTLIDLAAARFDVDAAGLRPETDIFDGLRIDSIRALDLMTEVEEHFDVEVPDYELQDIRTFAELAALVERRR